MLGGMLGGRRGANDHGRGERALRPEPDTGMDTGSLGRAGRLFHLRCGVRGF